ncbi:uncharacterized [Tachysurus ichikawai]
MNSAGYSVLSCEADSVLQPHCWKESGEIYYSSLSAPLLLHYTITEVGIALLPSCSPALLHSCPLTRPVCFVMQKHGLLAEPR